MNVNIKYKPTNPFLPSLRECGSPHLRKDGPIAISKWPQLFKVGAPKAGRVSWHIRFFFGEALWTLVFRGVAVLFDVAFAERLLVMCFWPALAALPGSVVLPLTFGWQSMIHIISGHVVECTSNQCSMGTTSCRLPWCSRELEVLSRWILIITRLQSGTATLVSRWTSLDMFGHAIISTVQLRLLLESPSMCFWVNILSRNGRPDTSWTSTTKTVRSWSTDFVFSLPEIASTLDAVKLRTSQKTPKLCWIWFEPCTSWCVFERQKTNKNKKGTYWTNMYIYLSRSSMCQKLNSGFRMIILVHWPIGSWVSSFCEAQTFSRPWRPWEVHRQSPRLPKPAAVSLVSMQTLSTGLFIPFR